MRLILVDSLLLTNTEQTPLCIRYANWWRTISIEISSREYAVFLYYFAHKLQRVKRNSVWSSNFTSFVSIAKMLYEYQKYGSQPANRQWIHQANWCINSFIIISLKSDHQMNSHGFHIFCGTSFLYQLNFRSKWRPNQPSDLASIRSTFS